MTPLVRSTSLNRTRQHATTPAAPRHAPRRPARSAAALALRRPADALDLQHRAGNQAVVRTLARQETGLKQAKPTNTYARDAAAFAKKKANGKKTLKEFATHLVEEANKALKNSGIPEMTPDFDFPGPGHAAFDREKWRIGIYVDAFSRRAGINTVADLSLNEAQKIVESIWHESRHAEQYFRIGRMRAAKSTKKKPEDVAAELTGVKYDKGAAEAAAKAPLAAAKGNEKLLAEAAEWESFTLGLHQGYKEAITNWEEEVLGALKVVRGAETWNVGEIKAKLAAFVASWTNQSTRDLLVDSHLKTIDKLATKSAADEAVLKHLRAIKPPLEALKKAWKGVVDGWDTLTDDQRLTRLKGVEAAFKALETPLFAAYQAHPHEADARAAGEAAGAEFRKRVK